jgi:hypothetical protein
LATAGECPFGRVAWPDDIAGAITFLRGRRAGYIVDITST